MSFTRFATYLILFVFGLVGVSAVSADEFVLLEETTAYPAEGHFSPEAGTITTWVYFEENHPRRDHIILSTDDSRFVLLIDTYNSSSRGTDIMRIAARAGGNRRAVDSGYSGGNFPEASIIVNNEGLLDTYGSTTDWYAPRLFPEGEWHHVAMTWEGYSEGVVKIYLDGELIGHKPYNSRYDDGRPLPTSFAVGYRPSSWVGELIQMPDGITVDARPVSSMNLADGGIQIAELRLYQSVLSADELFEERAEVVEVLGATTPLATQLTTATAETSFPYVILIVLLCLLTLPIVKRR